MKTEFNFAQDAVDRRKFSVFRQTCWIALLVAAITLGRVDRAAAQSQGGAVFLSIAGASDTRISLPYQQAPVDSGGVTAISANSLTLSGKSWSSNQFAYKAGQQPQTYYAEFFTGALQGAFYTIIANDGDTLVLDTKGDDLTNHPLGEIASGDLVKVTPYWTVAGVFGATQSDLILDPRTSPIFAKDDVLLFDNNLPGSNKAPSTTLYFLVGKGWTSVAAPSDSTADVVIPPGSVMVVRRRNTAPAALVNMGLYGPQRRAIYVHGATATSANDQYVSLALPEPLTLNEANLAGAVVKASANSVFRNDEVLVWRNNTPGFNTPANTTLFYQTASGWLQVGNSDPIGDSFLLQPGEAIIIRKKQNNAAVNWLQMPPQ